MCSLARDCEGKRWKQRAGGRFAEPVGVPKQRSCFVWGCFVSKNQKNLLNLFNCWEDSFVVVVFVCSPPPSKISEG